MIKKLIDKLFKKQEKLECSVDDIPVSCNTLGDVFHSPEAQGTWFTGTPAPVVLEDDPWFGSAPEYTEKQQEYQQVFHMEKVMEEERKKSESKEPDNIHEVMYNLATKNQSTTVQLDPPGGSENFQEGGWNSGTGQNQFRSN